MQTYKFTDTTHAAPIIDNTKQFLLDKYSNPFAFGTSNLLNSGVYREMGRACDFGDELTLYVYKQYGNRHQAYAPNKTLLRKCVYGRIDKILQA